MAITSGFFNSLSGDRKYDARQMGEMFDGLIEDGVFMSIGDALKTVPSSGMTVAVGTGRAWFLHTWTKNDSDLLIQVSAAESVLNRIDTIVLDVDNTEAKRANDIFLVKGTPSSNPKRPSLADTDDHKQIPLADILVPAGSSTLTATNITNLVGTKDCPYVTGPLSIIKNDDILAAWQEEFDTWFDDVKGTLGTDTAGNLLNKINDLTSKTIGKTLESLDEVKAATEVGYYVDALAVKETEQIYEYENDGMELCRYGPIVICKKRGVSDGVLGSHLYQNTFLKEIPNGYKPKNGAWAAIAVVTGNVIVDYLYINVDPNGETYQIADNGYAGLAEYNINMTWFTADPVPVSS